MLLPDYKALYPSRFYSALFHFTPLLSLKASHCITNFEFVVVRVPGYRSRGLGSLPDAARFSEK
jgi:hypothetical protein